MYNSLQEIFDTAFKGVYNQGCKSFDNERMICLYRGRFGTKCAFGHLVPYELLIHVKEDVKATNVLKDPKIRSLFKNIEFKEGKYFLNAFIAELQNCHDLTSENFIEDFVNNMKSLARRYNLNTDIIISMMENVNSNRS